MVKIKSNRAKSDISYLDKKWSEKILDQGWTAVPNLLIQNLKALDLSASEFTVLIAIESHRWTHYDRAFPSVNRLAAITGLSARTITRCTSSMVEKGCLLKIVSEYGSIVYDMKPLIKKLDKLNKM